MTAAASSLDRMDYALNGLRNEFESVDSSGFVIQKIKSLIENWSFLRILWESIDKLRAGDVASKMLDLGFKIAAAGQEISQDLMDKKKKKKTEDSYFQWCNQKIEYSARKTNDLMAEVAGVLDSHLPRFSFQLHSPPDNSFWSSFVTSVWNLESICVATIEDSAMRKQVHGLYRELELILVYMDDVCSDLELPAAAAGDDVIIINDFMNQVASVILRIAFQFCNYWFAYKTETGLIQERKRIKLSKLVLDLQHEIHPSNPKFMEFNLHFLVALCKIGGGSKENFVRHFCHYVVASSTGDFASEVSWLVILLVKTRLGQDEEENQIVATLFAEINALLVETASLLRNQEKNSRPLLAELLIRICLLKVELFLVLPDVKSSIFPLKYQFDQMVENLRRFSKDLPHGKAEYGKQTLALIEQVDYKVAFLSRLFEAKKTTESLVKNSILLLLLNIIIFKAEAFFTELLLQISDAANFVAYGKGQIALLEQLNLFTLLSDQLLKGKEEMDMIFSQSETFDRGIMADVNNKMILSSSELLDKVKHMKAELKEIIPQFPLSDFPKIYKLGTVRDLEELLKYDTASIARVKHHVKEIQKHFKSLSSFLMKISNSDINENPELKDLGYHVANIAYKIEYVVDSIEIDAQGQHFFWFYDLLEELRIVNKRASETHLTFCDSEVQDKNVCQVPLNVISWDGKSATSETVVDLRDEERVIIDQLTGGSSRRGIVSIVGMPGIGKTTLAKKMFDSQNVMYHFHRRAWCTVSPVYQKRELLLEILSEIHGLTDEIDHMNTEDLQSKLRQCLLKNRYLIVMDDVWDVRPWNDLRDSCPDDSNGSRILITSRLHDVAVQIDPRSRPHSLRLFSDDESWKLLEGKVFCGEGCPQELFLVGKEIAQNCKGLPLAVVAISSLLQRTGKSRKLWEKIAESLSSQIMEDPEARCMEILELSYKHLPGHLKACFLYLGNFLEDKDIPVSKLIQFWLAEGFIGRIESKSLEDVAEEYLMDLIGRSLVIISKRRSNGKVKACRVHDLIHDMCKSKAKEEHFLQAVTRYDEPYASFPRSNYGFDLYFGNQLDPVTYNAYRLSIFLKRYHFVKSRPSGLGTRSLIFFASVDSEPRCPYDISFICHNFKFLRVLDCESINMGVSFPVEIGLLVLLRYLAVSGYTSSIPQSIANLRNLETFVVKALYGVVVLPSAIWHMIRLRHLHVNNYVAFKLEDAAVGGCSRLENLVSLCRPTFFCGEDGEEVMKRFPNLRKLKCVLLESRNSSSNCDQFPRLGLLTHLESLNILYYGRDINTTGFILPSSLRKLTLSDFHLPWNCIAAIGRLPKLEILKLLSGAFEGRIWDMGEEEFRKLKFLKLDTLNIAQWNASCDHIPRLERLVIQNCKDLEKIPYDFADITTLETIEVHWCGQSAEESAKEIGEATGEIKVLISSSY